MGFPAGLGIARKDAAWVIVVPFPSARDENKKIIYTILRLNQTKMGNSLVRIYNLNKNLPVQSQKTVKMSTQIETPVRVARKLLAW